MKKNLLYIIIPCYNEEEVLPQTIDVLDKKLTQLIDESRIDPHSKAVYVNDGSRDDTWDIIKDANNSNDKIQGINLSRNFGHQNALLSGLMTVKDKCDLSISMDADLQDDINAIDEMIDKYNDDHCDVVYGVRDNRDSDSAFKRMSARMYYKFLNFLGGKIIYDHADFRLLSKTALYELEKYKEVNLFLRGIIPMLGFKSDIVLYTRGKRAAGESKYPLRKMIAFAIEGITSLSVRPIRVISWLGFFIILASVIIFIYTLIQYSMGNTIRGWSSTIVTIVALGGVQLLSLGVIGEYIGKIYLESKHRPRYTVEEYLGKND